VAFFNSLLGGSRLAFRSFAATFRRSALSEEIGSADLLNPCLACVA